MKVTPELDEASALEADATLHRAAESLLLVVENERAERLFIMKRAKALHALRRNLNFFGMIFEGTGELLASEFLADILDDIFRPNDCH